MMGNKQKCTKNTATQYALNVVLLNAPRSSIGLGVLNKLRCLRTASPHAFNASETNPHTRTLQPNPTCGVRYCTIAGNMTAPTLVPADPNAMASPRLRWKYVP